MNTDAGDLMLRAVEALEDIAGTLRDLHAALESIGDEAKGLHIAVEDMTFSK